MTWDEAERALILATVESVGGDKRRASEILGMSLKTLYNRMNVYDAEARGRAYAEARGSAPVL